MERKMSTGAIRVPKTTEAAVMGKEEMIRAILDVLDRALDHASHRPHDRARIDDRRGQGARVDEREWLEIGIAHSSPGRRVLLHRRLSAGRDAEEAHV